MKMAAIQTHAEAEAVVSPREMPCAPEQVTPPRVSMPFPGVPMALHVPAPSLKTLGGGSRERKGPPSLEKQEIQAIHSYSRISYSVCSLWGHEIRKTSDSKAPLQWSQEEVAPQDALTLNKM